MSRRHKFTSKPDCRKCKFRPEYSVQKHPTLDIGVYEGAEQHVYHEANCLKHQSPLAGREFEVLFVVTLVSAVDSNNEEGRDDEVESGGNDAVVIRLRESVLLSGIYAEAGGRAGTHECNEHE